MSPAQIDRFLAELWPGEAEELVHIWRLWARPSQLPPPGDWRVWLLMAGRGFGKTRAGAEWVRSIAETSVARSIALVGDTEEDVRQVMVEGPSGILAVSPRRCRPRWHRSLRRLEWPSGTVARCFSASDPEQLRGPEFDLAWADEIGKWQYEAAWDNLMLALRAGDRPRCLATTTPRPRAWLRDLAAAEGRWRTWRRFEDSRNAGRATAAAIASAIAASEQEMTALVGRRIADEATARSAAITSAVSTAIDDLLAGLPAPGLDHDAVTGLIEAELEDERTARNDAIAAATSSLAAGRQALVDASITAAITTERVAADRRTDEKLTALSARVDTVADDVTAESVARVAAVTAAGTAMEARVTAERDARTTALATQRRAVTAEIAEAKQEAASALQTTILAEHGARDQAIATAKSEVTRDTATHVADLLRSLEGRIGQTINAGIAAAGFPRGTRMLFQQSAAPAGWTKDATINDKALRVTGGSVGSGGSRGFLSTFGRPRVAGSVSSSISGQTGAHRLSVGEMPSHSHQYDQVGTIYRGNRLPNWRHAQAGPRLSEGQSRPDSGTTGGNQPHSHSAGSLRVSSAFTGNALDFRLAYVDVIVAVKD